MSRANLVRLGAGLLIALSLGGCYYPYWHHGDHDDHDGGYGDHPHYYWR
ncbi:MAG: hypothetical protein HIU92_05270 [Proteobacteria bacterium]|nr:hypothetical protein [Pseudomonadota bacterium]